MEAIDKTGAQAVHPG
jgi:propionyl-CoA carboxylase alpha chain